MKCPYCGSEVNDNAAFCPVCRRPLLDEEPVEETEEKDHKRVIIKASVCAAALLTAGLIVHHITKKD